MINFGDSPIPTEWKTRLCEKLSKRSHVFSTEEWDVGLAKGVEPHIRLSDAWPFHERSRRLAPADIEDVRKHLQELLHAGIISESRSPYASPIVVVRKKNGTIRMCIDYGDAARRRQRTFSFYLNFWFCDIHRMNCNRQLKLEVFISSTNKLKTSLNQYFNFFRKNKINRNNILLGTTRQLS